MDDINVTETLEDMVSVFHDEPNSKKGDQSEYSNPGLGDEISSLF
jgi:hypothetical protein